MSSSDLVSKCVLRVEVEGAGCERGAEALDAAGAAKGRRSARDITVETYPSRLESPRDDWGLLPARSRDSEEGRRDEAETEGEIGFFSGNPFVEVTKGILHLYKEEWVVFLS